MKAGGMELLSDVMVLLLSISSSEVNDIKSLFSACEFPLYTTVLSNSSTSSRESSNALTEESEFPSLMTGNEREFCEPDFSDFSTLKVDTEHADKVGGFFSTSGIELQSEDGLELAELEADLFELPLSKFSYNKLVDFSLLANSKRLDRVSEDFSSGKLEIIAIFSRYD